MPDLRTVLTETQRAEIRDAISAHRLWNGRCEACGAVSRRESDHMADVVIETLAGLPGVAVTQLPDADPDNDPTLYDASFKVASDDEYMTGARTPRVCIDMSAREIYTVCTPSAHISAAEARSYAAALLAAAVVLAEGKTR